MELLFSLCLLLAVLIWLRPRIAPAVFKRWLWLFFCAGACLFSEYLLLLFLPTFRLSFGSTGVPMVLFSFGHLLFLVGGLLLLGFFRQKPRASLALTLGLQIVLFLLALDGLYVEPFRLTLTRQPVPAPQLLPGRPLRILQISDLHLERITRREREVLKLTRELQPDLIVLTGDYVNLDYLNDETALAETRQVLSELEAPFGIYAILGSVETPRVMSTVFAGLPNVQVLRNEIQLLDFPGGQLALLGVTLDRGPDQQVLEKLAAKIPPQAFSLLLYHTPDLIETASVAGIDLYLAGHTHGGQIRLPFYGALYTSSLYGKQYEMGAYRVEETSLYVSRGLGMEGFGLPRLRFLCPPELVLLELGQP
jgi:predicted MPP superfamily phosphohydrolase